MYGVDPVQQFWVFRQYGLDLFSRISPRSWSILLFYQASEASIVLVVGSLVESFPPLDINFMIRINK